MGAMIPWLIFGFGIIVLVGIWAHIRITKLEEKIKRVDKRLTKFLSVDGQIIQRIFPRVFRIIEENSDILDTETKEFIQEIMQGIKEEIEGIFGSIFKEKKEETEAVNLGEDKRG
ncbi:hypothetical protein KJA13_00400 [Patescibacteria group bacterium]|nr:hypothetical protein [Patescibacteria group bacterium]